MPEPIALIRQISRDNPLWGAPRTHGELLKLGHCLARSTVSRYMERRDGRPKRGWLTFLRNHGSEIAAIDLFTVHTLTLARPMRLWRWITVASAFWISR